eukprot:9493612-Pyramimonas_sp.AAC.1
MVGEASQMSLADGLAEALPGPAFIGDLLHRIFHGETIAMMLQDMRETVGQLFDEFTDLSVDATVNIMQSISGN